MVEPITREEFLDKKRDYSPFLVHLTKDDDNNELYAKDALDMILDQHTLKAYNHFFLYSPNLENQNASLIEKFKVVCFTETPIDQIDILLDKVIRRTFKPCPYGLVFRKDYIREQGGNPVFYVKKDIAKPLWKWLYEPHVKGKEQVSKASENICKLLALVTVCEDGNDWHWEREWRTVGDLDFGLTDIYCGLCPEEEMPYFEHVYGVLFISPYWRINKILAKLVKLSKGKTLTANDIPF